MSRRAAFSRYLIAVALVAAWVTAVLSGAVGR